MQNTNRKSSIVTWNSTKVGITYLLSKLGKISISSHSLKCDRGDNSVMSGIFSIKKIF